MQRYSYEEGNILGPFEADLFVISIYQIYFNARQLIPADAKTISSQPMAVNRLHT